MQILINNKNEITAWCTVGSFDDGVDCTIPDSVLADNPLAYKYINREFVKNADYGKPTLSQAITDKISEINTAMAKAIIRGTDATTSKGVQHFTMTDEDQINITNWGALAKQGKTVPYHADGEACRPYSPEEMLSVIKSVTYWKAHHTTYGNLLKHQIMEYTDINKVAEVTYGETELNDTYKTQYDESMALLLELDTQS